MVTKYKEELPKFMDMMEKLLITNQGGDGYFVSEQVGICLQELSICFALVKLINSV